jgi:glutamate--cysteine ligase
LDAVWDVVGTWTPEEHQALDRGVAKHGFNTPYRGGTIRDVCVWLLELAQQGLERRDRKSGQGEDESCYLGPLHKVAQSGRTFAEQLLERFEHQWQSDIDIAVPALCEETLS